MKQFNTTLFILLLCLGALQLQAQNDRYLEEVFDDVTVTPNVVYGTNATVLFLSQLGEAVPQELLMDVYEPVGDTLTERPMVIYFHTGNFLPIQVNGGLTGTYRDSSVVEICTRLAKMGYVAVSADYRLGWNPLAETQPERALGLIQAAYRGVQDARTAIRYFKRDATESGNTFGVDTSRITLWGQGTGSYITYATATLDEYTEIITTQNPQGKFLTDLDGDGTPDPMIIEAINGDIYGTSLGQAPPNFPPFPAGDTLCIPNHVGYNSDFQLAVQLGGALGDISWLEAGDVPMISFHHPNDEFAPYESAVLIVPTTGDPIVEVQGAFLVAEKSNELGNNDVFAGIDDEFTQAAQEASATAIADHEYLEGLYPVVRATNMFGREESAPWEWWNAEMWDTIPNPSVPGASFHQTALLNNANMSKENAQTFIDTVMGYFAPRAYAALDLGTPTAVDEVLSSEIVNLRVGPNPASEEVVFQTDADHPMKAFELYDMSGRLIKMSVNLNEQVIYLKRGSLSPGIYFAKIRFDEGIVTQKVIFK